MKLRLLRIKDVMAITGLSKSYIYRLSEEGKFPKRVNLTPQGTSVAWLESEIQTWIEQKISTRNQQD